MINSNLTPIACRPHASRRAHWAGRLPPSRRPHASRRAHRASRPSPSRRSLAALTPQAGRQSPLAGSILSPSPLGKRCGTLTVSLRPRRPSVGITVFGFELLVLLVFVSYLIVNFFKPMSLNKLLGHPEYEPLGRDDDLFEPDENRLWRMSPDPDRALVSVANSLLAAAGDPAVNWTASGRADAKRIAAEMLAQVARPANELPKDRPSARIAEALEVVHQLRHSSP